MNSIRQRVYRKACMSQFSKLRREFHSSIPAFEEAYIVAAKRTPVGARNGVLRSIGAAELASSVVKAVVERSGLENWSAIHNVVLGHALPANSGYSPARRASLLAGLPVSTDAWSINQGGASGIKSVNLGVSYIENGLAEVVVAGGMESASSSPIYVNENGYLVDCAHEDGQMDGEIHIGNHIDKVAQNHDFKISRELQDDYAARSYQNAILSQNNNKFLKEIIPLEIETINGDSILVSEDEWPKSIDIFSLRELDPVKGQTTITAGTTSPFGDGAAALFLAGETKLDKYDLVRPLAVILAHADSYGDSVLAPSVAIRSALAQAKLQVKEVHKFEIDETFAAITLLSQQLLGIDLDLVNIRGGSLSLGNPVGASGTRSLVTLIYALQEGEIGVAVASGNGSASAVIVQRL
ncbi:Thiolase, N-terminal domain-containing protein [Lipomyces japonicus]|uniref:Thiolase, N-terminal domain-containing protein n=1 Tax=Lipomyces japonicus TaxID=56871 RepID=UPI0034D018DD